MNRYLQKIATFTETDDRHLESLIDDRFDSHGEYFGDGRKKPVKPEEFIFDPLVRSSTTPLLKSAFEFKAHNPLLSLYGVGKWTNARIEERPVLKAKKDELKFRLLNRLKYTHP